jgi:hypothetical protein
VRHLRQPNPSSEAGFGCSLPGEAYQEQEALLRRPRPVLEVWIRLLQPASRRRRTAALLYRLSLTGVFGYAAFIRALVYGKVNADLASPSHYEMRRAKLAPLFRQHVDSRAIHRVLDYGGDHGDLMLGLFGDAQLLVYDISGAEPASGVSATADPAACKADLILNSNVLEHVGFPRTLAKQIFDSAPSGGLVFFEVPYENALGFGRIIRRIAQAVISSAARLSLTPHFVGPAGLYMMHEHINYFTERALITLMERCGGKVLASGWYPLVARATKEGVVWCLGEKQS